MKALLALLICVLGDGHLCARCSSNGIYAFPAGPELKQNSLIILTGFARSQDVINGLNSKYPVYLEGGGKKIKLIVTEICVGQFRLTQTILKPETMPEPGVEYTPAN